MLLKLLSWVIYKKKKKASWEWYKSCFQMQNYRKANAELEIYRSIKKDVGEISDGYHTFNQLYNFRKMYNACLFNEWAKQNKYEVHKSQLHYDGDLCFGGGWFIVSANLPTGQISNHYEIKDWELFKCDIADRAKYPFDGHTAEDVLDRLKGI